MRRALFLLALLCAASPAWAHKIKLFATAEGTTIAGYAYFSGGGRAQEAAVAAAAAGRTVYQGHTDDQGAFRFEATARADHRLTVDSGDGHVASFTIAAAELPESLPAGDSAMTAAPAAVPPVFTAAPADDNRLAELVARAVARQVRPLREQLDAYEQTTRWRDALGGIGFIVGLGGLAYGMAQRRREKRG